MLYEASSSTSRPQKSHQTIQPTHIVVDIPLNPLADADGGKLLTGQGHLMRYLIYVTITLTALTGCTGTETPSSGTSHDTSNRADAGETGLDSTPQDVNDDAGISEWGAPPDFGASGPFSVGVRTETVTRGGETIVVELWYPTEVTENPDDIFGFVASEWQAKYQEAVALSEGCSLTTTSAARDVTPRLGDYGAIVVSHCHQCTRFSLLGITERLASHGFVVASLQHVGNSLFDLWAGDGGTIGADALNRRSDQLLAVTEALIEGAIATDMNLNLTPETTGVLGHSFGAPTAGSGVQSSDHFSAAVALAAPMENPLTPGVFMENVNVPVLFVRAEEDNSISTFGDQMIIDNHAAAADRAWLYTLGDAGHWSFTSIAALDGRFLAGCGEGKRMVNQMPFTYPPIDEVTEATAAAVTLFFARHIHPDSAWRAAAAAQHDERVEGDEHWIAPAR